MSSHSNQVSVDVLHELVPISNLCRDNIELIARHATLKKISAGNIVFNEGETDDYVCYLLEGELELISTNNANFHILSGTDDARYPLAQFQPRQYTAKTVEDSSIVLLDRKLLDSLLVGHKVEDDCDNGVEVSEIDADENEDWMSRILQSPLYSNISVENIQKIFSRIESIDVKENDVIINQGDDGDYYYIIQMGQCRISRQPHPASQDIHLAYLREGDAFGEEAIIANLKRNASVTMLSDGRLMRLSKHDFKELILNPILKKTDIESAKEMVNEGAVWLDVRYPDEYQDFSIEDSINIPLNMLRLQVEKLDKSKHYITLCDTSARSTIAAYILAQYDFNVFHLDLGLKNIVDNHATELVLTQKVVEETDSAEILPFKNITKPNHEEHERTENSEVNAEFKQEITRLREELDNVKHQFQEISQIKNIATELERSVINSTEKKLHAQREKINQQTIHANKLIQQAQALHKSLDEEKRTLFKEVESYRKKQEDGISRLKEEINKRLLEEEKRMQAFYSWKSSEIEKIKKMKAELEMEYIARQSDQKTNRQDTSTTSSLQVKSLRKSDIEQETDENEFIKTDLKQWLAQQLKNERSPINMEIKKAKQSQIEEANKRSEKYRKVSRARDTALTAEIDALLKGSK